MEKKLGLSVLIALVLSSILGADVSGLPQNMAAVASPTAPLIGWGITGAGILLPASAMLILTRIRPEFGGGILTYAREGFGELIGFCSAWGYWLCAAIVNASYLVIVFSALSFFTDTPELRLLGDSNAQQSIVGASALLWIIHFLIPRGIQTAASINFVATLAKLLSLGLFVVPAVMMFKPGTFKLDFTGLALGIPVWEQMKNTMLTTLWVFIGVEGVVVVSVRARNKRDVGKVTPLAVLPALGVYLLVTPFLLGVVARPELAEIRNLSVVGLMVEMMGPWGEIIIAAGLIVSVCDVYLNWTIMAAEVPFLAATHEVFLRIFACQNAQAVPSAPLWLINICMQICLVLIWLTGPDYSTLLTIASEIILVPYFLVGAFLLKIATRPLHKVVDVGACIYGLWLLYTPGLMHLLSSAALYAPGLLVFLYARKAHTHDNAPNRQEMVLIGMLSIALALVVWMLVG